MERCWAGKKITLYSTRARWISATVDGSSVPRRSTPRSSAPVVPVSGVTVKRVSVVSEVVI